MILRLVHLNDEKYIIYLQDQINISGKIQHLEDVDLAEHSIKEN